MAKRFINNLVVNGGLDKDNRKMYILDSDGNEREVGSDVYKETSASLTALSEDVYDIDFPGLS
jgi:hypothetical protein